MNYRNSLFKEYYCYVCVVIKTNRMKRVFYIIVACFFTFSFKIQGQEASTSSSNRGLISLGVRNSISMFNDGDWNSVGTGAGGQFRIQLSDKVNTEWFYDYLTANVGDFAHRTDEHIGWSVLFYPLQNIGTLRKIEPYVLAGHCFDYSLFTDNNLENNSTSRWSMAVQAGFGMHFNFSKLFNISTTLQYMIHLSNDISATDNNGLVTFTKQPGVDLVGHILFNVSANFVLGKL